MNTKLIFFIFIFLYSLFCLSCSKKNNTKLAQNYYKLSILELGDDPKDQNYKKSLEFIDKAIDQKFNPEYLAFKATLLFKINKIEEGLETFDQALELKPEPKLSTEILNNKACLLAQAGIKNSNNENLNHALDIWQNLKDDKDYQTPEVALVNMGLLHLSNQNFEQAKNCYIDAINFSPNYLDAHYFLAVSAYKLKDFGLAKKEISTILFVDP
ncbi:hypothetical protein K9L05_02970, partial [Candidatus Babeliales bacterium]|nr:hypothetical protein [Candidatus Babeliales bacterium]